MPELPENSKRLRGFNQWLSQSGQSALAILTHPTIMRRALGTDLGIPAFASPAEVMDGMHEADGLEWPLRLAALWQMASAEPLRRTQQGEFFKRDQERLRNNLLLNSPPPGSPFTSPGVPFLMAELALALNPERRGRRMATSWIAFFVGPGIVADAGFHLVGVASLELLAGRRRVARVHWPVVFSSIHGIAEPMPRRRMGLSKRCSGLDRATSPAPDVELGRLAAVFR